MIRKYNYFNKKYYGKSWKEVLYPFKLEIYFDTAYESILLCIGFALRKKGSTKAKEFQWFYDYKFLKIFTIIKDYKKYGSIGNKIHNFVRKIR